MRFNRSRLLTLTLISMTTACGIDVKTPPDFGVKVNLDTSGVEKSIRSFTNGQTRHEYFRFLNAPELKQYILDQGRRYNARCLVPTKKMVDFENQEPIYTFVLSQRCYYQDPSSGSLKELRFDISGAVNTKTLKYEFSFEPAPEFTILDSTQSAFQKVSETHDFLSDPNSLTPTISPSEPI